jgi:hypothetical protein
MLINEASGSNPGFSTPDGDNSCFPSNQKRGYVVKFNEGIVNSTKYFHPADTSNYVLDVPALKLSRCFDFCGNSVYTDYLAALVRYNNINMFVIMDGHHLDIKAMFYMESHWVSTHRMFHYQNIIWNIAHSGNSYELDKYKLFAGLTKAYVNSDGQRSGDRYYRVRSYQISRRPREGRSQDQSYRWGVTALLWHQRYLYTAGQRDWSSWPRPYFAKFNENLDIVDAYHVNTGNNYVIHNLHSGASTGWNYRIFGLAHGHYRYSGDRFNQTYSRQDWNLIYFDTRFAHRQFGCGYFFQKTIIPQSTRYVRIDHIFGTSTMYFLVHQWDSHSNWKSFRTDSWTTRPSKVRFDTLWNSYCRYNRYNYKSYDRGYVYEWRNPNCGSNCYMGQMTSTSTGDGFLTTMTTDYFNGYQNGRNKFAFAAHVSYYTNRGFYQIYYRSFSDRSRYQYVNYWRYNNEIYYLTTN